jgi:hypothetical protein
VDTTGSSSGYDPQPVTTAPEEWSQNPYVQVEGGFLAGLSLGVVPFGGVGQQLLDAGQLLPHGTPEARRGLAVGLIVGGVISLVGGLTGEVAGGIATVTVIGAAVGVPAIAVSTTLVVGGVGNIAAGIRGLSQSMMSSGSGPKATAPASTAVAGYRETFFRAHPQLRGQVVVHHAIEQQVLKRYPGLFTEAEIHALNNLRGIPKGANPDLHLSQIRRAWNDFYRANPSATKQQIVDFAADLDTKFGSVFLPPR